VDLEKAFDRVPREVIRWAMCKLGVEEWLVAAVTSMYTGAKTVVRTVYGNSKGLMPISVANWLPSVLGRCWLGHLACKNRPRNDL